MYNQSHCLKLQVLKKVKAAKPVTARPTGRNMYLKCIKNYNWRDDLSGILLAPPIGCQADFLYKLSIILEGFSILELINYLSV